MDHKASEVLDAPVRADLSGVSTHRVTLAAAATCALLAAGNAVAVRVSNREMGALWGASLRFALSAVVLLAVVRLRRLPLPRGGAFRGAVLYGLLNFAGAFGLAYYGLVRMEAGMGGALLGLVPLVTLVLAALHGQERLRSSGIAGALLALAGVAVVSRASLLASVPPLSVLALIGSAACFGEAAVLVRGFPPVHPVTMNAVGMAIGAVALWIAAVMTGETVALPRRTATWAALAYLVPLGSMAVFVLYLFVLQRWEASRAVYVDVVIPLVTPFLAAGILGEALTASVATAGVLIVAGVYLGAVRPGLIRA